MILQRSPLFFLLFHVATNCAMPMVIEPRALEEHFSQAVLVAEIEVLKVETFADDLHKIRHRSTALVSRVTEIREDGMWIPSENDIVTIVGIGGELDGLGMMVPGHPRPHRNQRYKAHLRRAGIEFEIAGFDMGLKQLHTTRSFSRNRTDGSNGQGDGPFLFWDDSFLPIPYFISSPSFKRTPQFVEAIDTSFHTWRDPQDVKVEFLGLGCSTTTRNENDGINSVILVHENWPFDAAAIAITRNFYIAGGSAKTGVILDSDILLNGVHHAFTTTKEIGKHDVQNIVTHEIGHFLGLGHEVEPIDPEATMFAVASPNETKKRQLKNSDLEGLKSAYLGVGQKLPLHTPTCEAAVRTVGCASTRGRGGSPYGVVGIFLSVILSVYLGRLWRRRGVLRGNACPVHFNFFISSFAFAVNWLFGYFSMSS